MTHDLHEALLLGDRIAILHEGHLEQIGTKKDILDAPATQFVRDLFTTRTPGTLTLRDTKYELGCFVWVYRRTFAGTLASNRGTSHADRMLYSGRHVYRNSRWYSTFSDHLAARATDGCHWYSSDHTQPGHAGLFTGAAQKNRRTALPLLPLPSMRCCPLPEIPLRDLRKSPPK